jgi:hypothetical protein
MPQDYTTVHLNDGTTVHLKGQLTPDQIGPQLAAFQKPPQPSTAEISQAPSESLWQKTQDVFPVLKGQWLHQPMPSQDVSQLAYPERAMSPETQQAHPIITGASQFAGALTTPENLMLTATMAKAPATIAKLASAYFTAQMSEGAYNGFLEGFHQWKAGNHGEAERVWTQAGLNLVAAKLAANHAMSGEPALKPEENPIAASGKTETEVKTTSSLSTGLAPKEPTYEELKARIAAIEARTKKPVIPAKLGEVPKTIAEIPPITAVMTPEFLDKITKKVTPHEQLNALRGEDDLEQARRGAPAPVDKPVINQVPEAERASTKIVADQQTEMARKIESREAAKETNPPQKPDIYQQIQELKAQLEAVRSKEAAGTPISRTTRERIAAMREAIGNRRDATLEGLQIENNELRKDQAEQTASALEVNRPGNRLETKQADMRTRQEKEAELAGFLTRRRQAKQLEEDRLREENAQLRNQQAVSPEVGPKVAPPKAAQPPAKPVPTPEAPTRSGEPLRAAAQPEVAKGEPRSLRGDLGERPPVETKPASGQLDFAKRIELQRQMVESMQQDPKYKGVAKARLQEIANERIKKERGSFGGGGPEDARARREAKINEWLNTLRDEKADPKSLDNAYKMLQAYGLSHDDIIQRMAGGADFAQTSSPQRGSGDPHDALAQAEREREQQEIEKRKAGEGEQNPPMAGLYRDESLTPAEQRNKFYFNEVAAHIDAPSDDLRQFTRHLQSKDGAPESFAKLSPEIKNLVFDSWDKTGDVSMVALKAAAERQASLDAADRLMPIEEKIVQTEALVDGRAVGESEIKGVLSSDVQELRRMFNLKDIRNKERGSLSFRRLSPEEREHANPIHRLADALDRIASFFEHPQLTDEQAATEQKARNIMREALASKARSNLEVYEALKTAIERHDNPTNERDNFIAFMDAGEGKPGAKFLQPEDQAMANVLHDMFKERWERIEEVKGREGGAIENYLAHIWEKAGKAGDMLRGLLSGKRPLEGSARFMKQRFWQYASSGVEHGLVPVTWNPIRLQLGALFDVDRFLMAHDIKDRFVDAGLAKWTKLGDYKNLPEGWEFLNEKIFQPKVMGEGALKEYGRYAAPREVARLFNRYLSPGLEGNPVFRNFRNYGNALNMIELGISGYHGTMISLVSATSDLSLGLQKVLNYGDYKGGIKDMLRGSVGSFILRSSAMDYNLGKRIQSEAIDPTGNQSLQKFVDLITTGGGRFKQDAWYTRGMSERKGFVNWLKLAPAGKFQEMAFTGVRKLSGPIMEKYVPRVKLGVASRMMEAKLADLQAKGITDPNTIATEMGKIWDSVDNRAGQMVYDNLFWNNAAKDLAFASIRAVGWDLGSFREYGGAALIDAPRQAAKLLRGQRPELTSRLAFTIATPLTIGLFGGMVHYLMTGKAPSKSEDYFFPGPDGAKVSFPSYMKDYFAFKSHPLRTAVNKLHPTLSQMYDLYSDTDFYGTEIYHPGDPLLKKGLDVMKWYGKSFEPLSVQGITKRIERGEPMGSAVTGMFGFMPAPSSVNQTKAESLAVDLASRQWQRGPRTSAEAERFQLVQQFQRQVGSGQPLDIGALQSAWASKKIQDTDLDKIYSNFGVPKLQREFKELNLPDALAVMREATPDERVQLKPLLLDKYDTITKYPPDMQQAYDAQIRSYLQ